MKKICLFIVVIFSLFQQSCGGCSRSGSRYRNALQPIVAESTELPAESTKNIVRMRREGGVFYIPIEVNGILMEFIFDTGASIISISETEVSFLQKQGGLTQSDFLGPSRFIDATGTVSEGIKINLKSVKIGEKTLNNVEASVVGNQHAPLLLGQSALGQFGKLIIDYENNLIILE